MHTIMEIKKQIEINISDAITEKPFRFTVGKRRFSIYPPTLGKTQILKNLYLMVEVDAGMLAVNPLMETLRICREKPGIVCRIIAYSTFRNRDDILNDDKVLQRAAFFREEMSTEDLATILSFLLSYDCTDEFTSYFGIDEEKITKQQIARIKGEGSSLTFGGKSIYGLLIDFACQRYGWTMDYVVWGISYVNLSMLFADSISTVYLSEEERKKLGMGAGEVINADDPKNRDLVRRMISE